MSDSKFRSIASNFVRNGTVVVGDVDLGEESTRGSDGAMLIEIIATEERLGSELKLEGEKEKWFDEGPEGIFGRSAADVRIITADSNGSGVGEEVVATGQDSKVVVSVVVIRAGFACESHAGERTKLAADVGFQKEMVINQEVGNGETRHFLHLKDDGFASLRLVKSRVVIAGVSHAGFAELSSPGTEVSGSVASIDKDTFMGNTITDDSLIFLDGAEEEDDSIMGEGESLTGFPGGEQGILIDLVLGFGKDADNTMTPGGVRTGPIRGNSGFSFAAELVKFIVSNAVSKKAGIKSVDFIGIILKKFAPLLIESVTHDQIFIRENVGGVRRAKAKSFLDGAGEQSRVFARLMFGSNQSGVLSSFSEVLRLSKLGRVFARRKKLLAIIAINGVGNKMCHEKQGVNAKVDGFDWSENGFGFGDRNRWGNCGIDLKVKRPTSFRKMIGGQIRDDGRARLADCGSSDDGGRRRRVFGSSSN